MATLSGANNFIFLSLANTMLGYTVGISGLLKHMFTENCINSLIKCILSAQTHLCILTLAVPARIQMPHPGTQCGGDVVTSLPIKLRDAIVYGVHLFDKVFIQLQLNGRDMWHNNQMLM